MGIKVEDLEILDIQETGWQKKIPPDFCFGGNSSLTHAVLA